MRKGDARVAKKQVPKQTLATTTPLVQELFDNMFEGQMDDKALKSAKKQRCGICEVCRSFCLCFVPPNIIQLIKMCTYYKMMYQCYVT